MDISEKILKLRKANNLTQEQLAEQLQVSRQAVSKWESGQAIPESDKLPALSDLFHVTIDYLLRGRLKLMSFPLKRKSWKNNRRKSYERNGRKILFTIAYSAVWQFIL